MIHSQVKQLVYINFGEILEINPVTGSHTELSVQVDLAKLGHSGYRNVSRVELKAITFPQLADDIHFAVEVPEFTDRIISTNPMISKSFAIVYYNAAISNPPSTCIAFKGSDFDSKSKDLITPLAQMRKFHVTFRKQNGHVVKRGDIQGTDLKHVTLLFEFTKSA